MSVMTIFEPITVSLPTVDTLEREIRAGRWQNAAAISGRSQHSLRDQYDPTYVPVHKPALSVIAPKAAQEDTEAFAVPRAWLGRLRQRMAYLGVTMGDLAVHCGVAYADLDVFLFKGGGVPEPVFHAVDDYLWPKDTSTISAAKLNKAVPNEVMPRDGLRAYSSDRVKKRPPPRKWLAATKIRMDKLAWTTLDLATATGMTRRTIVENVLGEHGYCSDMAMRKVEAALTFAEGVVA